MGGQTRGGLARGPALLLGIALTGLVGLVGLASRPTGEPQATSSPGAGVLVLQVLTSWAILASGAVLVALVALWPGRRRKRTPDGEPVYQPRLHWALRLGLLLLQLWLVAALVAVFAQAQQANPTLLLAPTGAATGQTGLTRLAARVVANFGTVFTAVAVVTVLVVAAASGVWLWTQRRAEPRVQTAPPELARAVDDGLAALEHEADPRRAVILAYVAMERALARQGLAREAPEAPIEYMLRVLAELPASHEPVHRLTDLFEEAKFSQHVITPTGRAAAVEALVALRAALAQSA